MKIILLPLIYMIIYILKTLFAILLTIIWGIPTLLIVIGCPVFHIIWNFKLKFYKLETFEIDFRESITKDMLWSETNIEYKSYFHTIWNIYSEKQTFFTIIINKLKSKLN